MDIKDRKINFNLAKKVAFEVYNSKIKSSKFNKIIGLDFDMTHDSSALKFYLKNSDSELEERPHLLDIGLIQWKLGFTKNITRMEFFKFLDDIKNILKSKTSNMEDYEIAYRIYQNNGNEGNIFLTKKDGFIKRIFRSNKDLSKFTGNISNIPSIINYKQDANDTKEYRIKLFKRATTFAKKVISSINNAKLKNSFKVAKFNLKDNIDDLEDFINGTINYVSIIDMDLWDFNPNARTDEETNEIFYDYCKKIEDSFNKEFSDEKNVSFESDGDWDSYTLYLKLNNNLKESLSFELALESGMESYRNEINKL